MIVAAMVIGGVLLWNRSDSSASGSPSVCNVETLARDVLPSVVTISANGASGGGTGSGEVIRSEGYILTNNHVISEAANGGHVSVLFSNGTSVDAEITGRDIQTDLAVLKVKPPFDLDVITIGSSSDLVVGQPVVALGAPLGLSGTVTSGIVSALGRTVNVPADNGSQALLVSAIQTDAAINPGNSGGSLVDCAGDLVGIPTAGATVPNSGGGNIGLGFAIPVNSATRIADEIIDTGSVTHAYFGISTVPIPESAAGQGGTPTGLFVTGVDPGGPAASAGLQTGDIVTKLDGNSATTTNDIQSLALTRRPGETIEVTYYRNGETHEAKVTLGST